MPMLALTFGVMFIAMGAMAVGVMFSGKSLKGSCGGVGNCAFDEAGIPRKCETRAHDHDHDDDDDDVEVFSIGSPNRT